MLSLFHFFLIFKMNFYVSSSSYVNTLQGPKLASFLTSSDQVLLYGKNSRLQAPSLVTVLQTNNFYDTNLIKLAYTSLALKSEKEIHVKTDANELTKLEDLPLGSFLEKDCVTIADEIDEFDFVKGLFIFGQLTAKKLIYKNEWPHKIKFVEKLLKKHHILYRRSRNTIEIINSTTDPDFSLLRHSLDSRVLVYKLSQFDHKKLTGFVLGYLFTQASVIFKDDENFIQFSLSKNYFFDSFFTLLTYILGNYVIVGDKVLVLDNQVLMDNAISKFMKYSDLSTQQAASSALLSVRKKYYRNLTYIELDMKDDELLNINNMLIGFK